MKRTLIALAILASASQAHAMLACSSADLNFDDPDGTPGGTITTVTWQVGQPSPDMNVGPEQVVVCAATGAELAYILQRFPGVPQRKNSVMTIWRGDSAVFILDNL